MNRFRCVGVRRMSILGKQYRPSVRQPLVATDNELQEDPAVPGPRSRSPTINEEKEKPVKPLKRYYSQVIDEPAPSVMFPTYSEFEQPANPACSVITVFGAPNSGKSTLTNALVGERVSIVTQKAQTTRQQVTGMVTEGAVQLVFQDTPGVVHAPAVPRRRKNVQKQIAGVAMGSLNEADMLLCVVDGVKRLNVDVHAIVDRVRDAQQQQQEPAAEDGYDLGNEGGLTVDRTVLVVNKSDLSGERAAHRRADDLMESGLFGHSFCVSAIHPATNRPLRRLREFLMGRAIPGPWMFNPELRSDFSAVETAEEIVRQKLYERINHELPYAIFQRTEGWTELKNGDLRIDQTILVPNERIKRIIVGAGGQTIRHINMGARYMLSKHFSKII